MVWILDHSVVLGTGIEVAAPSPSPGWHTISLRARDSLEQAVEPEIRVFVGHPQHLPMLLKR